MKTVSVPGLDIRPPKNSAFAYDTPEMMPTLHQACLIVGPRGSGKTTACVNLMERLPFDRIFAISPSMKSNKELMQRLKLEECDIFEDPDDISCIDKVKAAIEQERDDLEKYQADMIRYKKLMKYIHSDSPLFRLPDDALADFYRDGDFKPPEHKWGGRRPCMALVCDDCVGAQLYTKGIRKLNQLCIYHRHLGQLKEGGALGCSLFFLVQSYKCASGGISKCIRNNVTSLIVFSNKNQKQLEEMAEECAGEVEPEVFKKVYEQCIRDKHDFMFIDLNRKPCHPSMFRRNLSDFVIPQ